MPVFRIHRHLPLSPREISQLPGGAVGVRGQGDVVARLEASGSLERLLKLAFHLGCAVPDARMSVDEAVVDASADPAEGEDAALAPRPDADAPELERGDALDLIREGKLDAAEAALTGKGLTPDQRNEVRGLFQSTDPTEVVVACVAVRLASQRSYAVHLRRHLTHGDSRVKIAAVEALGVVGGPSLIPALRPLTVDDNPEIKEAALAAVAAIDGD